MPAFDNSGLMDQFELESLTEYTDEVIIGEMRRPALHLGRPFSMVAIIGLDFRHDLIKGIHSMPRSQQNTSVVCQIE